MKPYKVYVSYQYIGLFEAHSDHHAIELAKTRNPKLNIPSNIALWKAKMFVPLKFNQGCIIIKKKKETI